MTVTHLPPHWRERICAVLAAPATFENLRLLDAWQRAEGGTAQWNPLNTTLQLTGATDYNTAGVKNYHRATEGVCATALTLVNGNYEGIVGALQNGGLAAPAIVRLRGHEFRTWGTDPALIAQLLLAA